MKVWWCTPLFGLSVDPPVLHFLYLPWELHTKGNQTCDVVEFSNEWKYMDKRQSSIPKGKQMKIQSQNKKVLKSTQRQMINLLSIGSQVSIKCWPDFYIGMIWLIIVVDKCIVYSKIQIWIQKGLQLHENIAM